MKRRLSLLTVLLVLAGASAVYAGVSTKKLVGSWQGSVVVVAGGQENSQAVTFTFAAKTLTVTHSGKDEVSTYKIVGNDIHVFNKDGSKREAILTEIKLTAKSMTASLKPDGEEMPAGVTITLKLTRSK